VQPESVESWEAPRKHGRWAEMQGALALGFAVEPDRWRSDIAWLFKLRNAAVHPRTAFGPPTRHPTGGRAAPEYAAYSA
jgi:hypothetical protein